MSDNKGTERLKIAFILKGYPRLSETFIAQEILALETRGLEIDIWSLRHPTDKYTHQIHDKIQAAVHYLPEYLLHEPFRVMGAWYRARKLAGYGQAFKQWWADFKRDRSMNRLRRFGQACVLAVECDASIQQFHAHFLHTPASVARYGAAMRECAWSCSAHAKDIWTSKKWELKEKLQSLIWLTTCTRYNAKYLSELAQPRDCVFLNYHGLDLSRFERLDQKRSLADGRNVRVELVSVGRAVRKKGYLALIECLAALPKDLQWHLTHIGDGPLLEEMKITTSNLGLTERIDFRGALPQGDVIDAYRSADVFVLNSTVEDSGDRDGLPNVLVEAQSQGLPVIATAISGIPELLIDGMNGILIIDGDAQGMINALDKLITQPILRHRLGESGYEKVCAEFSLEANIIALRQLFKPK